MLENQISSSTNEEEKEDELLSKRSFIGISITTKSLQKEIGMTDKIIASNPELYENRRVVIGKCLHAFNILHHNEIKSGKQLMKELLRTIYEEEQKEKMKKQLKNKKNKK